MRFKYQIILFFYIGFLGIFTSYVGAQQDWSVFAPKETFQGSPQSSIGHQGLFDTHRSEENMIAILPNGEDSFAARIKTLEMAKKSIRIQALIFTGDEAGLEIAKKLKEKHAAGIEVKIIVDALANLDPYSIYIAQTQWMYFDLKQSGIEVEGYEAFWLQWINEISKTDPLALNKRYHEKIWIIDGETDAGVAIVGGLNIANEYFRVDPTNPKHYWRDQDVIVKGSVVKDMVNTFERNFEYFVSIKKSRGILNTNNYWELYRQALKKLKETNLLRDINSKKLGEIKISDWIDPHGKLKVPFNNITEGLTKRVSELAKIELKLQWKPARCRFFQNRPRIEESYIQQSYLKMIKEAKEEILIANAYFIPLPDLRQSLIEAVKRGVRVIILTNSPETNDLPLLTIAGRRYYQYLLEANDYQKNKGEIEIWEWLGLKIGEKTVQGTIHAKYAVFDKRVAIVGSYNLDPRSAFLNSESVIIFENEGLVQNLADLFYKNDLSYSRRITRLEAQVFKAVKDLKELKENNSKEILFDELQKRLVEFIERYL